MSNEHSCLVFFQGQGWGYFIVRWTGGGLLLIITPYDHSPHSVTSLSITAFPGTHLTQPMRVTFWALKTWPSVCRKHQQQMMLPHHVTCVFSHYCACCFLSRACDVQCTSVPMEIGCSNGQMLPHTKRQPS